MTKILPCPDCDGRGYFSIAGDNSVWSLTCDACGGLGTIEVPMTNADHIRDMNDEDLVEAIISFCGADLACDCCVPTMRLPNKCDGRCRVGVLKWLKQPKV